MKETVVTADATPQPAKQTAPSEPSVSTAAKTSKTQEKIVEATRSRSEIAASHFAGEAPALPSINQPPLPRMPAWLRSRQ
jgi:hypothetical protein